MNDIIQTLRDYEVIRDGAGADHLETAVVEAIAPKFVPMSDIPPLSAPLARRLGEVGVSRLYAHQAEAINHAMAGKNVVLEAPTASGKTLSFAIPVLESLLTTQRGHAMLIYPMKAVAADQRKQLERLHEGLIQVGGKPIASLTYDGDVTPELRRDIRNDPPSILMTNIEFIHKSFLGNSALWQGFLQNLRWIVIDEMHEYRGYFGTNAAMVLRRLWHHLKVRGGWSQFFLATATSQNPMEHATNLTGQKFELVRASDGLRPKRNYAFIDPNIPPHEFWSILHLRAALVACAFDRLDMSAIVFCPTRKFAESAYQIACDKLEERSRNPATVRIYKGGMLAQDREEILRDLNSGEARIVFSTNALELGIDITGLDAIVMVGFPDNVMSARQQIGRAGRDWRNTGTVVYLARNNHRDRFFARRLDEFLDTPLNELVTDLGNATIASDHGDCVWFETGPPDMGTSLKHLGEGILARIEEIYRGPGKPDGYGIGKYTPHHHMHIRGASDSSFELRHGDEEVGTLSSRQKFNEAYDRAILLHGGIRYRVQGVVIKSSSRIVELVEETLKHRTDAPVNRTVKINKIFQQSEVGSALSGGSVTVLSCEADVTEFINLVAESVEDTEEIVDKWELDSTSRAFFTRGHATAWKIDAQEVSTPGLIALEHLFRIGVGFVIPVDQHDVFTATEIRANEIYVIESFPGGIGIAARIFDRWQDILRQGMKIAQDCDCTSSEGCPYCIVPPRRHDEMNKAAGLKLAERLLELAG